MRTVATSSACPPVVVADTAPVTFEVLSSDDVERFVAEWDACARRSPDNPFGQTPWFASAVWLQARPGSDLCLLVGRDAAGTVQALTPLCLTRPRVRCLGLSTVRPLALHCLETSSIVVGEADRAAATSWLVDQFLATELPDWDVLHFDAIDPGSVLFGALVDAASRLDMTVLTGPPILNPVVTPRRAEVTALPGPSARFRRNIRRAWRLARDSGRKVVCSELSWEWRAHAAAIGRLYAERWGAAAQGGSYALDAPGCQEVLELLFGRLDRYYRAHLFGAFVDDELGAYVICFRAGREVVLWSACLAERFRPLSIGMLLWDYCLHEMAGWRDVQRINFGKGADRYKLDWSDASYAVCELAIVRATGAHRRRALRCYRRLLTGTG